MSRAEKKVPGGKLVRLAVDKGSQDVKIRLSGDFFIYPEEGLTEIEELLARIPVDEPADRVKNLIGAYVVSRRLELVGIDAETIASLFTECFQCGE